REAMMQVVDEAWLRLARAAKHHLTGYANRLSRMEQGLDWLSPQARITRLTQGLEQAAQALQGAGRQWTKQQTRELERRTDRLGTTLGPEFWKMHASTVFTWGDRLTDRAHRFVDRKITQTKIVQTGLTALDPHAPLERGYSLVKKQDGTFLRDSTEICPEELVEILPAHGRIMARVVDTEQDAQ
ncbi:MAG: hypothetical protein CSA21_04545, partial [Deltaproteobacteria bacterium]